MKTKTEDDYWQEGYDAHLDFRMQDTNPYDPYEQTSEYELWDDGWIQADNDLDWEEDEDEDE